MDNKKRTQTIVMLVLWSLVALASIILFIKLIVTGNNEFKRWLCFAVSLTTSVIFISDGIKRLKKIQK